MISEGCECDTEEWSNDAEYSFDHRKKLQLFHSFQINIINNNPVFCYVFNQINAAMAKETSFKKQVNKY